MSMYTCYFLAFSPAGLVILCVFVPIPLSQLAALMESVFAADPGTTDSWGGGGA